MPGRDLQQLLGIGRMMTTNDDHMIAFLAEVFRFLLPRPRCITYCIKYFGICTLVFQKFLASFPALDIESGLRYRKNRFLLCEFRQQFFQLCQVGKHFHFSRSMAHNSLYFGVFGIACHQQHGALCTGPRSNFMDFCNKRAGGVMIRQAAC